MATKTTSEPKKAKKSKRARTFGDVKIPKAPKAIRQAIKATRKFLQEFE